MPSQEDSSPAGGEYTLNQTLGLARLRYAVRTTDPAQVTWLQPVTLIADGGAFAFQDYLTVSEARALAAALLTASQIAQDTLVSS